MSPIRQRWTDWVPVRWGGWRGWVGWIGQFLKGWVRGNVVGDGCSGRIGNFSYRLSSFAVLIEISIKFETGLWQLGWVEGVGRVVWTISWAGLSSGRWGGWRVEWMVRRFLIPFIIIHSSNWDEYQVWNWAVTIRYGDWGFFAFEMWISIWYLIV